MARSARARADIKKSPPRGMVSTPSCGAEDVYAGTRVRASWGLTPKSWQSHNICVTEMPSNAVAGFCDPGATSLPPGPGGHSAVKPAAPLTRHHPHDTRRSGSGLGAAPRSKFALQRQPSVRQAALEQLPTPMPFSTGYFATCASGSRTANSGVHQLKPPRSQNYVKPHDARAYNCQKSSSLTIFIESPTAGKG